MPPEMHGTLVAGIPDATFVCSLCNNEMDTQQFSRNTCKRKMEARCKTCESKTVTLWRGFGQLGPQRPRHWLFRW